MNFSNLGALIAQRSRSRRFCPNCKVDLEADGSMPPPATFRPWRLPNAEAVYKYVCSLEEELNEWLLALFIDNDLNLLSVECVAEGGVSDVHVDFGRILCRGRQLKAAGFILVHNHPSGDPKPSRSDVAVTRKLASLSHDLDVPLLDHFIVGKGKMERIGCF